MIKKYKIGNPINTEAIIEDIKIETNKIPYFDINKNTYKINLEEDDIIYGLGEQIRGINKKGWIYESWNSDNPNHVEDTTSLYGTHNFLIIDNKKTFGVFFDYPGKITFDIGYTNIDEMKITIEGNDYNIYIIEEKNINEIVKSFRKIIGKSYLPPLWAFGYGQSRWGYKNEKDIKEIEKQYNKLNTPLDSIYLDIDYMDNYKDFTINKDSFKDMKKLVKNMKEKGIHLVPIIDAGVKQEKGYDIYEEGVKNNYFCKTKDDKLFIGAVWPGKAAFPDFLNKDARVWFGSKYEYLTKLGIDGFWNDMNEPAIFYTEEKVKQTLKEIKELTKTNMGVNEFFEFTDKVSSLNGNKEYYETFYHNIDGKKVNHKEVHNIYGMNMTRAASDALNKINKDTRTLFFSRSSYIGAHRYGGMWQGDNKSWWSHILLSMQQLPSLNMAGFLYIGSDMGGFAANTTEDLMIRWLEYSIFTPLFRNHSNMGTRNQELYNFKSKEIMNNLINIRYSLIPYLYSEFLKARENNTLMFKPLRFEFSNKESRHIDDQLLLGNEIMIAPIYKQNAKGRYVYLPEEMLEVKMTKYNEIETKKLKKGHHYIDVNLNELVFFIRKDKSIPLIKPSKSTKDLDYSTIKTIGYNKPYELYKDDGISTNSKIETLVLNK